MCKNEKLVLLLSFGLLLVPALAAADGVPFDYGYWPLEALDADGNVPDLSGNDHDGITNNPTPVFEEGYIGQCMFFDLSKFAASQDPADKDFITISDSEDKTWDDITAAAWVKMKTPIIAEYWQMVIGSGDQAWGIYSAGPGSDHLFFAIWTTEGFFRIDAPQSFSDNQWHHIAAIREDNRMEMYVDLELSAWRDDVAGSINYNGHPFDIGRGGINADRLWNGWLDEVYFYDRAVSFAELYEIATGEVLAEAWDPDPAPQEVNVAYDVALTWQPGGFAESHDVYLGTDFNDVNDAGTGSDVYQGNYPSPSFSVFDYDPEGLEFGQTYYWRIDEVNTANPESFWKGGVWSFTVRDNIIVDDFQVYTDTDDLLETWDGYQVNGSGAEISLVTDPMGPQWMDLNYDNFYFGPISEADLVYDSPQDWTVKNVKILALDFYGDEENTIDPLYVELEDDSGNEGTVLYDDPNDLLNESWQQWLIDLQQFTDQNVDLTQVKRLTIGLGEGDDFGDVYFDNILLTPPVCLPEFGPDADFNGDCAVNFADLDVMVTDWLASDYTLPVSVPQLPVPDDANLVALYTFDDGTAGDTSGFGTAADGTMVGDAGVVTDAERGKVLSLDGDGDYVDCGLNSKFDINDVITASAWVTLDGVKDTWQTICGMGDGEWIFHTDPDTTKAGFAWWKADDSGVVGAGGGPDLDDGQWHHVAAVYNGSVSKVYVDGSLVGFAAAAEGIRIVEENPFYIGENSNPLTGGRYWGGKIDEVRIYNYGLSGGEIQYLATEGAGTGLVGLYSFDDGTAADTSGYGAAADGMLMGDAAVIDDPDRGKVLSLDGDADYVDCGLASKYEMNDELSAAAWVKLDYVPKQWQSIMGRGDQDWIMHCGPTNTWGDFAVWKYTSGLTGVGGGQHLNDGDWHHVCGVKDETTINWYVDGNLVMSQPFTEPLAVGSTAFLIGENSLAGGRFWKGVIDDVRIYSYGLSAEQVLYLATDGTGYFPLQQRTANLFEDEKINFHDLAVLGKEWLAPPILWP